MSQYFEWIGAAILILLSLISGYKIIKEKTLSKNLVTLFALTILSTLLLFGVRPAMIEYGKFRGVFETKSNTDYSDSAVVNVLRETNLILEIDPKNPEFWSVDTNYVFKWYNAPYGLAIDELGNMNMNNIINRKVTYQLLLIEGNDTEGKREFQERFDRMRKFLIYMNKNKTPVSENVEVRVLYNKRLPSISIYLFNKERKKVANFYIDPLIAGGGKSQKAFQTYSESVVMFLEREFEDSWDQAVNISIDSFFAEY